MSRINESIGGDRKFGKVQILLYSDDDLTALTKWHKEGFTVTDFLSEETFNSLIAGLREKVISSLREAKIEVPDGFRLENYHKLLPDNQAKHLEVISRLTRLPITEFPVAVSEVYEAISDKLKIPVVALNKQTGNSNFHLRIVRPQMPDYNPLHRDVWLDRLRNGINLYVPVAGSTKESSLQVVLGSHLWSEAEIERTDSGAVMENQKFTVPAVTGAAHELKCVRPNPGFNQVLIFSPYLIHGEGSNLSKDSTRISLELRLWRR